MEASCKYGAQLTRASMAAHPVEMNGRDCTCQGSYKVSVMSPGGTYPFVLVARSPLTAASIPVWPLHVRMDSTHMSDRPILHHTPEDQQDSIEQLSHVVPLCAARHRCT